MWMQKSVEGSSFSSGNFHDRNRFGSQYAQGSSYTGTNAPVDTGDWKTKILESGQWLGGKVIEYGGKLARGPTTEAIPDHYGHQMPRNDGRANWMADIRSSSSSSYAGNGSGGYTGGYQNDFVTERPKAYSDFSTRYSSNPSAGGYDSKTVSSIKDNKSRHAKKKNEGKKSKKKSKKSKKKRQSESEEESEREEVSMSESSGTESDERRHKSKGKVKKKKNLKKRGEFYSESESEQESDKRKTSEDYSFSFDPAKLPPPPVEDEQKVTKKNKVKKSKSGKKSRSSRHSVEPTDNESTSEKEKNSRKTKKRSSKKAGKAASSASVDLLGVDLDVQPVVQPPTSGHLAQELQPSVFDAPQSQNPLQDLAGLSFAAHVQALAPTQPSVFDRNVLPTACNETQVQSPSQIHAFQTNLLPENNLVDLSSLVSEKKKTLSANPEEKRTLNDMQKARSTSQPKPVMAMPIQGQQQQDMSGSMMQLNMNQLQITDGATGMQQHVYSNMQMQQMPMQAQLQQMPMQTQMAMMTHPQMTHQQQFAQGGVATAQKPPGAANFTSSDPFCQLP